MTEQKAKCPSGCALAAGADYSRAVVQLVTVPWRFFERYNRQTPLWHALLFCVATVFVFSAFMSGIYRGALLLTVISAAVAWIIFLIPVLPLHGLVILFNGDGGLKSSGSICLYGSAAVLVGLIPWVGPLLSILVFFYIVFAGCWKAHHLTVVRSGLVVLGLIGLLIFSGYMQEKMLGCSHCSFLSDLIPQFGQGACKGRCR